MVELVYSHKILRSIEDIPESNDTTVISLNISYNSLISLKGIKRYPMLRILYCGYNLLESLEDLSGCPMLKTIFCNRNHLTSLNGIQYCPLLKKIDCNDNFLTSLEWCPRKLEIILCANNAITTLSHLKGLKEITRLDCKLNSITNLMGLKDATKLKVLSLSYNRIISLNGIKECKALTSLFLIHNRLTSLRDIGLKPKLDILVANENQIEKLEGLKEYCPKLRYFSIKDNKITTLTGCPNVESLILDNNLIKTFEGIGELPRLKNLSSINCKIINLSGLNGCSRLQELIVYNNPLETLGGASRIPLKMEYSCNYFPKDYNPVRHIRMICKRRIIDLVRKNLLPYYEKRISKFQRIWRNYYYDTHVTYRGVEVNRLCVGDLSGDLTQV